MRRGSVLHRLWWRHGDSAASDYLPMWIWRPVCWRKRGHMDDSYGGCVICRKVLG